MAGTTRRRVNRTENAYATARVVGEVIILNRGNKHLVIRAAVVSTLQDDTGDAVTRTRVSRVNVGLDVVSLGALAPSSNHYADPAV